MSTLDEIEAAAATLPPDQKQELLLFLTARLGGANNAIHAAGSEINKTPGVSGGAACVRNTRIAVWTLVQLKKLGRSESQLLGDFPSITQADLDAVWNYYRNHPTEVDDAIAAEDATINGTHPLERKLSFSCHRPRDIPSKNRSFEIRVLYTMIGSIC